VQHTYYIQETIVFRFRSAGFSQALLASHSEDRSLPFPLLEIFPPTMIRRRVHFFLPPSFMEISAISGLRRPPFLVTELSPSSSIQIMSFLTHLSLCCCPRSCVLGDIETPFLQAASRLVFWLFLPNALPLLPSYDKAVKDFRFHRSRSGLCVFHIPDTFFTLCVYGGGAFSTFPEFLPLFSSPL